MALRSIGFTHEDFNTLALDELYLRFCIAYQNAKGAKQ